MYKILIAEDEPELRKVLALELETSGYEVFLAGDGEEGFKLAQDIHPDLIIADVLMPKMDGNQFLKKLRESEFGGHIPFIVLSARGKMRDYFETINVSAFIEKPFDPDDLLTKIRVALNQPISNAPQKIYSRPQTAVLDKKRILILEDDLWLSQNLKTVFNDYGYEAKVVSSVGEFLEETMRFSPHLIISKFIMEGMNANKLVGLLREMPHLVQIPILVYSHTLMGGEKESVIKAGATDFLFDANGIKLLKKTNQMFHQ